MIKYVLSRLGAGRLSLSSSLRVVAACLVCGALCLGSLAGAVWATPAQDPQRQTVPTLSPTPGPGTPTRRPKPPAAPTTTPVVTVVLPSLTPSVPADTTPTATRTPTLDLTAAMPSPTVTGAAGRPPTRTPGPPAAEGADTPTAVPASPTSTSTPVPRETEMSTSASATPTATAAALVAEQGLCCAPCLPWPGLLIVLLVLGVAIWLGQQKIRQRQEQRPG